MRHKTWYSLALSIGPSLYVSSRTGNEFVRVRLPFGHEGNRTIHLLQTRALCLFTTASQSWLDFTEEAL